MEANNAKLAPGLQRWDAKALGAMYAEDALLIAAGAQPIRGAKDIEAYGGQTSATTASTPG